MKNNSPQKQAAISWIILMIGILLAVIGAMMAKEYRVNLCLLIGAMAVDRKSTRLNSSHPSSSRMPSSA